MRPEYRSWLRRNAYGDGTISARLYRVERVEEHYGDLDHHFDLDRLASIVDALRYSRDDERQGKPNPTLIPFDGVVRTNLASYRNAVCRYGVFLTSLRENDASGPIFDRLVPSRTSTKPKVEHPRTFAEFDFDGSASFRSMVASSQYATIAQAIASLTSFTHPDTVRQTGGRAIFLSVRDPRRVGEIAEVGGRKVLLDDNSSARDAFVWANKISRRGRDTQFNHIYAKSGDPDAYTALPNICMTPAFIAKSTDTNDEIKALIRFRSYDLYNWLPSDTEKPPRPEAYDNLQWAPPLEPVDDVRRAIEEAMRRKPKDRTVKSAVALGWLFGSASPDE